MSNLEEYSKIKYKCNHPESEFEGATTNPIEMKKENFVEYTRRNEVDIFGNDITSNASASNTYNRNSSYTPNSNYNKNSNYNANRNPYNYTTTSSRNSKKSSSSFFWIIFVLFFLPGILEVLVAMLNELLDAMY